MHPASPLLQTALFITLTLAHPTTNSLTKRHFWCNGVDSETICPQGETMVPIDSYACNAISAAGRLSQISAPQNGETSTTCPQAQNSQTQNAPAQNPPAQNPPAQNPPAQNPPAQNPPAQEPPAQNATEQNPPAQNPQTNSPKAQEQINQGTTTPMKQSLQSTAGDSLESTPFSTPGEQMNLTCTNVSGGSSGGMMLNCTVGA
ncbi:hypothetical protein BDR22DRAFT_824770 [Usnea florida]